VDVGLLEARAAVADVHELAALPHAEHERAEAAGPASLPLRVAADDELLPAVGLDLQPVTRALALQIARAGLLAHAPLELLRARRLEQRPAVVERLRTPHGPVPLVEQPVEPPGTLRQRPVGER